LKWSSIPTKNALKNKKLRKQQEGISAIFWIAAALGRFKNLRQHQFRNSLHWMF
jgi:hypothetical protein